MANIDTLQVSGTDYTIQDKATANKVDAMSNTLASVTDTSGVVTSDLVTQVVANTSDISLLHGGDYGTDADLDIADESGYVVARLADGHIKTKYFDSSAIKKMSYFTSFRAMIPIYKDANGKYYTTYDFEANRVSGKLTAYVDPTNGSDSNSGLTNKLAKKTITSALALGVNTIVLLEGTYTAGTHFVNGAEISGINLIGIGDVVIDNNGGNPFKVVGDFFVKNITFTNGNLGSLHTYIQDTTSICTYIDCKFNNSIADSTDISTAQSLGGLRIQGGTHYIYRCEASHNGFDGFNYHCAPDNSSGDTTSPHIAEVECKGFFNGDSNSYQSNNGSTAHDKSRIVRLNCEYGFCHGGIIADVHKLTISYNFGCKAYSALEQTSTYKHYQSNYFAGTKASMYLYGCVSHGSMYDISCTDSEVYTTIDYENNYNDGGNINKI